MNSPDGISPTIDTGGVWLRAASAPGLLGDRQRSFMHALGRHGVSAGGAIGSSAAPDSGRDAESRPVGGDGPTSAPGEAGSIEYDRARQAAEQLFASVFIQPILKELRAQNRAPAPFGPTDAEKAMGPLMDAALADRIVRAQQFGLVDRIASDLASRR